MKRIICLTIALCLILGSFSFSFAVDWSTTDQSNLSNIASRLIYNGFGAARLLYDINSTLSTISNTLSTISSRLVYGNYSISYWVNSIYTWMQPIYGRLSDIITQGLNIETVAGLLGSTDTSGSTIIRTPYLFYNNKSVGNWLSDLTTGYNTDWRSNRYWTRMRYQNGTMTFETVALTTVDGISTALNYSVPALGQGLVDFKNLVTNGYNSQQSLVSFSNPNSTVNFTPTSTTDGLYKYLNAINTPIARLGYVLASDSRIEAQQAAAANEQEVVDSFIDSSGSGAASTSDFSDMAGLSSGYSSNFNTGQSASGLFTVFGSDKWTYLTQETMDSFDTTGSDNRRSKSNTEYDTPYLDRYYKEVLSLMGLEND